MDQKYPSRTPLVVGTMPKNAVKLDLKLIKTMAYTWLAFGVKRLVLTGFVGSFNFQNFDRPLTGPRSSVLTGACYFRS